MTASVESLVAVIKRSGLVDGTVLSENLDSFTTTRSDEEATQTAATFAQYLVEKNVITLWQADKLLKGKHKGFFLGKYKLLRILGKGGMSSVYLAEHVLMRRRCAIKVLPHKRVADSSYLDRFLKEAQAVAALSHPNIVGAYDVDHETDGNIEINFLVMEYVEGQNLYELVQRDGLLSPVKTADLIRQGALGLEHAHQAGLVHRDIKPGNFLIDTNGIVKLMDLGLARMYEEEDEHSLTIEHDEKVLGTADYLAPEQAVDSHSVDTRADIYGLGCTMYYLLTGHPPFNEGTLTQRLLAHQTKQPPPVSKDRDDVPASLITILLAMMEKKKEDRIQTASEVVTQLTDWLHDHGGDEWSRPVDRMKRSSDSEVSQQSKQHREGQGESSSKVEAELGSFLTTLNESDIVSSNSSSLTKKSSPDFKLGKSKPKSGPLTKTQPTPNYDSNTFPTPSKVAADSVKITSSENITSKVPAESISTTRVTTTKTYRKRSPLKFDLKDRRTQISLGIVVIAILGIIMGASLFRSDPNPPPITQNGTNPAVPTPNVPARPQVEGKAVTVGPVGNFGTLQEAINYITQNALADGSNSSIREIQVAAGTTLSENIKIDSSGFGTFPSDVVIIGQGPQAPILKAKSSDFPCLTLNGVEKLRIENFIIDAEGQSTACELTGYLVGTQLMNLKFVNVTDSAIYSHDTAGLGGDKLFIENCQFNGKSTSATLVRFEVDTRKVQIKNCRFIGPAMSCLSFSGTAWDIDVIQNIFHECEQGVLLKGSDQDINSFTIADNTFHNLNRGIVFEAGPTQITQKLSISQNLFAGIKDRDVWAYKTDADLAQIKKDAPPWRNNWTDRSAKESDSNSLNIFADDGHTEKQIEFQSTDPAQSNFLKPTNAEVREVVKNKVGDQNFIGAVSP